MKNDLRVQNYLNSLDPEVRELVHQSLRDEARVKALQEEVYAEIPIDMEEFIYGSKYLGLPKNSIYPKVLDLLMEIDKPDIREAHICAAKGIGKSTLSSLIIVRSVYRLLCYRDPPSYFGLLPGEFIAVVNMSVAADQAENVMFHKVWNLINNSPWFKDENGNLLFKKKKRHIEFPKSIHALSGHSGYQAYYGYNSFAGVVDEIAWMQDTEDHVVSDEVYQGLLASAKTRFDGYYKIICISTPRAEDDFIYSRVKHAEEYGIPLKLAHESTQNV